MRSRIEGYDKVVKEPDLPQKVLAQIPAESGFDVDDFRSDNELHVVEINFGARSSNDSAQIPFRSTIDFYTDRGANHCVEKAIVRAGVDYGFEAFASRVIARNDLNGKHWPPDSRLFRHASIAKRKRSVGYSQGENTLGSQVSGI